MGKRLVFLYSSLNGFVISTLRALHASGKCEAIDIIYWDKHTTSGNSFTNKFESFANFFERSNFDTSSLIEFLEQRNPNIIYISGWMDKGYLKALRAYRSRNRSCTTVCGIDDQWHDSIRQRLGKYYFKLAYKKLFDRIWIAGAPQYHFARQLGYCDREIIYNLLSADSGIFKPTSLISKRFVYVGRLEREKGPDLLIKAYSQLSHETRRCWPLHIIGDGSLRAEISNSLPHGAKLLSYLQPEALSDELSKGGVGCQPSRFEQWGVSIHELAMLGFPLIVSSACGAASEFVIDGFNGLYFQKNDLAALLSAMHRFVELNNEELSRYSSASKSLGARISPETCAHNLLSADAMWRSKSPFKINEH